MCFMKSTQIEKDSGQNAIEQLKKIYLLQVSTNEFILRGTDRAQ